MEISSTVIRQGEEIPLRYTGEGEDVSPHLEWSGVPEGCRSFLLLCEDHDAPKKENEEHPFVHWLLYNLSPRTTSVPEGLPQRGLIDLPVSCSQGKNSFGHIGYNGPMPPVGHGSHRYEFTLYALSREPDIRSGLTRESLFREVQGTILGSAKLTGTFERVEKKKAG